MNKLVRAAQTSQTISVAAMEEASRLGLREADIEQMLLALVINDQSAGRALRSLDIDIDAARRAVEDQRAAQLASVGIDAIFPDSSRIVFHETAGYEWSRRASELLARSGGKDKRGDAAAVLRELVAEPSGVIEDLLHRLGTTPEAALERLEQLEQLEQLSPRHEKTARASAKSTGQASASTETFVSAPIDDIWTYLADPARIPDWEMTVGSLDDTEQEATPGTLWHGCAPTHRPDGKPVKVKPPFRRRSIELVTARQPVQIAWRFAYPDASMSPPSLTEFALATTTGGTLVTITTTWSRRNGWRRLMGLPLRPVQRFMLWIVLSQTAGAISRAFR